MNKTNVKRINLSRYSLILLSALPALMPWCWSDMAEAQSEERPASEVRSPKKAVQHKKVYASKGHTQPQGAAQSAAAAVSSGAEVPSSVVRKVQQDTVLSGRKETVTVTGSRLQKGRLTDNMASMTLGEDQIRHRGYTNIGMALMTENPNYSTPANSPVGAAGGAFGAGQTYGDLLGLGAQRTLTLVNGRRFVSSSTASQFSAVQGSPVDLANIPTLLIKKVDVVVGSGGPVYGSDAIAGVQNFILDDDYKGVNLTGQTGFSQKGDGIDYRLAGKAGTHFDHERGTVVFDVEYNQTFGMTNADRARWAGTSDKKLQYTRNQAGNGYDLSRGSREYLPFTQTGVPGMLGNYGDYPNYQGVATGSSITSQAGQPLIFSQDGRSLVPLRPGTPTGDGFTAVGKKGEMNGFPIGNYGNLLNDQQRLNLTTLGHYDFTRHLRFTYEAWYVHSSVANTASQPYYNTQMFDDVFDGPGQPNGAMELSTDNPFLTSEVREILRQNLANAGLPTDKFYLSRASTDYYKGKYTTTTDLFRFVGGLQGDFNAGHRHFDWKGSFEYGQYRSRTKQTELLLQNYLNALNAQVDGAGNIVCAPDYTNAAYPAFSQTCAPLNPFGYDQASGAARDYIQTSATARSVNQQWDLNADVRSTVMKLPAGDWTYDFGYEHRFEETSFNPGGYYRGQEMADGTYQSYGAKVAMQNVQGSYHTNEVFAETLIPLVSPLMHVRGVYSLTATGSARYVNNSMTGGFWAYSGGGSYAPVRDIVFHGNYTTSFRAPSVSELFQPMGTIYSKGTDPCDVTAINSGPNPVQRRMNCTKAGVPKDFQSNFNKFSVRGQSGGNKNLKNEEASQFTVGTSVQPRWVRGLSIGVDVYDVRVKKQIESLSLEQILAACYDSASYPDNKYCNSFSRNSDFQIKNGFTAGNYNIGTQHTRAMQVHATYYLPLSKLGLSENAGAMQTTVNYAHNIRHTGQILTTRYQYLGDSSDLRDNFTASFNYMRGPLFAQWQMQYYGKAKYKLQVPGGLYPHNTMKQYFTFNFTTGYTFARHYNVNFVMNNVFNARPQYPYQGDTSRYWNAILGRNFQVQAGVEF